MRLRVSDYKLNPCPFCGAKQKRTDKGKPGPILFEFGVTPDPHVRCTNCGATTEEKESREEAFAAWNMRAK